MAFILEPGSGAAEGTLYLPSLETGVTAAIPDTEGARGPFSLEGERELFARLQSDVLISKNSGSQSTEPKLQVARELGLPVLILKRPDLPVVTREFDSVERLWQALATYLETP